MQDPIVEIRLREIPEQLLKQRICQVESRKRFIRHTVGDDGSRVKCRIIQADDAVATQ